MKDFLLRLKILLLLVLSGQATLSKEVAFPDNIKFSFSMELLRNPGINENDLKYIAKQLLMTTENLSLTQANERVNKLNLRQIKKLVTSEFNVEYYDIPIDEVAKIKGNFFHRESIIIRSLQRMVFIIFVGLFLLYMKVTIFVTNF